MRLIDADGMTEGRVENDPVVIAAKCAPTAYDPDKVVEQLEELNKYKLDLADAMLDMQSNGLDRHFICLEDAIEIVKAGGIE